MARKRTASVGPAATPVQQGEADIIAEIGATPDEDGELEVDEAKIREVGAVDAESVIENRRVGEIIGKVRAGQKGVSFNLDNVLQKYDGLVQTWPPNTLDILVRRVTGTPVQWVITSRPKSGGELYAAILAHHGRYEEAEYDVRFVDYTSKQKRGTGRITMPDMRDTPPTQQGQPMNQYGQPPQPQYQPQLQYPPQQAAPPTVQVVPPTVDPVAMMGKMFEIFQQMRPQQQQPPPAVPQPVPAPAPASFPGQSTDPMAMMSGMFEIFQKMQPPPSPASSAQQQPPPPDPMAMMGKMFEIFQKVAPSPSTQAPSAQPSTSTDPMTMMQESFRLFQQMQPPQASAAAPPPPPQGSDPSAMIAWMLQKLQPPPQAPSPDPMAMMSKMFEMFERMQRSVQPPSPQAQPGPSPGPYRGPYGGPRPYYGGSQGSQDPQGDPRGDPRYSSDPRYPYQPPQQQRPKTATEEFKDAATVIDMAMSIADRFRPPAPAAEPEDRYRDRADEPSPVRVVDVGGWPVIVDRKDGSARKWETVVANTGNVLKWAAEQREAIQKANAEREAKQQRQQRPLPEGYVEVTPGYKPPPGYVAIPVDELPPPPRDMPQPISQEDEQQPPPPKRAWGPPTVPQSEP